MLPFERTPGGDDGTKMHASDGTHRRTRANGSGNRRTPSADRRAPSVDRRAPPVNRRTLLRTIGAGTVAASLPGVANGAAAAEGVDSYPDSVGINLGGMVGRGLTFVDAATTMRPPEPIDGGGEVETDGNGWPTEDFLTVVFDQRPVAAWEGDVDDPEAYVPDLSGTWHVEFSGRADVSVAYGPGSIANRTYDEATNTTTLAVEQPAEDEAGVDAALMGLAFADARRDDSDDADGGITDLRIVHPDYEPDAEQTFREEFLELVEPFPVFRFMDWLEVNDWAPFDEDGPVHTTWDERTTPEDATQRAEPGGIAWEYVVELCNETGADAWINIPVAADDDYVERVARMLANDLDPGTDVYVEYANEMWNFGFVQYSWNSAKAEAEVESGDGDLDYDGADEAWIWSSRREAKRCVEIGQIFAGEFGEDAINDRVKVLLGWDPIVGLGAVEDKLAYVDENYGPPDDYLWGLMRTAYYDYGGADEEGDDGSASEDHDVDDVLDVLAESIPDYDDENREIADEWGLAYVAYEGGDNTSPGLAGGEVNVEDRIRAARHERNGELLERNVEEFVNAGGDLYAHFTVQSAYSRYGTWGATDDINEPRRNHKYGALVDELLDWEDADGDDSGDGSNSGDGDNGSNGDDGDDPDDDDLGDDDPDDDDLGDDDSGDESGNGDDSRDDDSIPGFGIVAGVAGVAGGAACAVKKAFEGDEDA